MHPGSIANIPRCEYMDEACMLLRVDLLSKYMAVLPPSYTPPSKVVSPQERTSKIHFVTARGKNKV